MNELNSELGTVRVRATTLGDMLMIAADEQPDRMAVVLPHGVYRRPWEMLRPWVQQVMPGLLRICLCFPGAVFQNYHTIIMS